MTNFTVAQDTWNWLKSTGRVSGEAETVVNTMGVENFLNQAVQEWEAAGCNRFMEGMKAIMLNIIWGDK